MRIIGRFLGMGLSGMLGCLLAAAGPAFGGHFANGIKIGEVDGDSAVVWTRLTRNPAINLEGAKFADAGKHPVPASRQLPEGKSLDDMLGAVPGATGEVRVTWQPQVGSPVSSEWKKAGPETDCAVRFELTGLQPATDYVVTVEERGGRATKGRFRTAPPPDVAAPVTFAMTTCQEFVLRDDAVNGHKIYKHMLALSPDFFVHAGDLEYYDRAEPYATDLAFARFKMTRMYGLPNLVEFHRNTPGYFIKDDHDTTRDDAWPGKAYGDLSWQQGCAVFREQFPVLEKNYRTVRWGRDLQVWLVEGRDFRSPNNRPDGPGKTIWGWEQKEWFFRTVAESDATFKVLVSPTPLVGPDRTGKNDNHANEGFSHEGDEIRRFIAAQTNMFVACGDRHWQYVSVHAETGVKEFACGSASDAHAGGWSNDQLMPEHRYLDVQGGFLAITVERISGKPVLTARHYNVDGVVCNEDVNEGK